MNAELECVVFGMGCFWGPDARLGGLDGVVQTRVGYAGGTKSDPTYRSIGRHAEVVRVVFDPARLSFEHLFAEFRHWFTPTKAQRATRWSQYRPVVFADHPAHREVVAAFVDAFEPELRPQVDQRLVRFWSAEAYHQKYRLRRASPALVAALQHEYGERWDESELATKCNAVEERLLVSGQVQAQLRLLSPQSRALFRAPT